MIDVIFENVTPAFILVFLTSATGRVLLLFRLFRRKGKGNSKEGRKEVFGEKEDGSKGEGEKKRHFLCRPIT